MPEVNFATTGRLDNIAGISDTILQQLAAGKYPGIAYKVHKLSDIKKPDLQKLPREAYLTITHTRGAQYTRAEVKAVGKEIIKKYKLKAEIVGSYRRGKTALNDIDILAVGFQAINPSDKIIFIRSGTRRIKMLYKYRSEYYPVDILFTTREQYPFALMHFTGSKEFNIHMSKHATARGYKLSVNGLSKGGKYIAGIKNEKDIFAKLGLKYIPPEKRDH